MSFRGIEGIQLVSRTGEVVMGEMASLGRREVDPYIECWGYLAIRELTTALTLFAVYLG